MRKGKHDTLVSDPPKVRNKFMCKAALGKKQIYMRAALGRKQIYIWAALGKKQIYVQSCLR